MTRERGRHSTPREVRSGGGGHAKHVRCVSMTVWKRVPFHHGAHSLRVV